MSCARREFALLCEVPALRTGDTANLYRAGGCRRRADDLGRNHDQLASAETWTVQNKIAINLEREVLTAIKRRASRCAQGRRTALTG